MNEIINLENGMHVKVVMLKGEKGDKGEQGDVNTTQMNTAIELAVSQEAGLRETADSVLQNNINIQISNEANLRTNAINAEVAARTAAVDSEANARTAAINTEANIRATADSALNARIDSFTHLQEGTTTLDAEIIDARVGADGMTYPSLGSAIRTQVTDTNTKVNAIANFDEYENLIQMDSVSDVIKIGSYNPTLSVNGNELTITQDSRANMEVAIPIIGGNTTDNYEISVVSDITLQSPSKVEVHVSVTSSSAGYITNPLITSADFKTWSTIGKFNNPGQKYIYIMLDYNHPTATFTINVKKANPKPAIDPDTISGLDETNFTNVYNNKFNFNKKNKTLVMINFEEPDSNFYQGRQQILDSYGFKGSFALTGNIGSNAQLRLHELVNAGHDIALYNSATAGRPDSVDDTTQQAEWDAYVQSIVDIAKTYGIHHPTAYHCKFNEIGVALYNSLLKCGFKVARCTNAVASGLAPGTADSNYIEYFDKICVCADTAGLGVSQVGALTYWLDNCIANGYDLSVFGHDYEDIGPDDPLQNPVHFKKYILTDFCDYLATKIAAGQVEVVTWKEYVNIRNS